MKKALLNNKELSNLMLKGVEILHKTELKKVVGGAEPELPPIFINR